MRILVAIAAIFLSANQSYAWTVDFDVDTMTSKPHIVVRVDSENEVRLSRPYTPTKATLAIRHHPRFGKDVILVVDSGQLLCKSYSPCEVMVRFDDKAPMKFKGDGPSSGNSKTAFISGYDRFTKTMYSAKRAVIEVEFFRDGIKTFTFDIAEFPHGALKKPSK